MSIPTVTDIKEAFVYQADDFEVNAEYPTKNQMQDVRKKLMKNLTKLPCIKTEFDNYKWAVVLVKADEYAQ